MNNIEKYENDELFEEAKKKGFLIDVNEWETPASLYPNSKVGNAKITHSKYNNGFYDNYNVNGYAYFRVTSPITITELQLRKSETSIWETWMVDDPPHWWSMQNYAKHSYGNVLVAGLGLGLVTSELIKNTDVNLITVVEINKDVIDLISPFILHSNDNVTIIEEDFYKFISFGDSENYNYENFDRIIVDLWTTSSSEETQKVYHEEVIPLYYYLKILFPDASIAIHGFGIYE